MYYYDPNDRKPRRWAILALLFYMAVLVSAFVFVTFDISRIVEKPDTIEIEFLEPEPQPDPEPQPVESADEPRMHEEPAPREELAQNNGPEEESRTPNPRALFPSGRVDDPEPDTGNPHAPEGPEQHAGTGTGDAVAGELDRGLQGRGLVGTLPRPAYPGSQQGKVVIRVTVGPEGNVQSASFEPVGSTIADQRLINAAREAALKARFTESAAAVQGGTITYVFRMK